MRTKAFRGLIPAPGYGEAVAAVPYDVVSTEEARNLVAGQPHNLLHVDRAEIDLPPGINPYDDAVYARARENFDRLQADGILVREKSPCVYVYQQKMGTHEQAGVVLACHIDDYGGDIIRKHEKTRPVKEDDRTRLADTLCAHTGPIFLTYKDDHAIDALVSSAMAMAPLFEFTDETGVTHVFWRVDGGEDYVRAFAEVPLAYVADGHHRSASAHRVGIERRNANPDHTGDEDYNWFLGVLFPGSQLQILPYNRVVKDLNGMQAEEFVAKVGAHFPVETTDSKTPDQPGHIRMYVDGKWYALQCPATESDDPTKTLDVSVLQEQLLAPVLGVGDPRTDERIDFIGGIRGTDELERRVDGGQWGVAFSMYPVSVDQLISIADAGKIMPPKSTWFEPKLRSGLVTYTFEG